MTRALNDGVRRVCSAPALLAAVAAVSLLSPLYPNTASRRVLVEFVLVGSFLAGGIIDRYARMRATRAYGFFGACGRHLGAMLRLGSQQRLRGDVEGVIPRHRHELAAALGALAAQRSQQAILVVQPLGVAGDLGADHARGVVVVSRTANPADPAVGEKLDFERAGGWAVVRARRGTDTNRRRDVPQGLVHPVPSG